MIIFLNTCSRFCRNGQFSPEFRGYCGIVCTNCGNLFTSIRLTSYIARKNGRKTVDIRHFSTVMHSVVNSSRRKLCRFAQKRGCLLLFAGVQAGKLWINFRRQSPRCPQNPALPQKPRSAQKASPARLAARVRRKNKAVKIETETKSVRFRPGIARKAVAFLRIKWYTKAVKHIAAHKPLRKVAPI